VLVAAYDSHATIGEFLAGLRRQTFTDFETIVIDSGPSLASLAISRGYPEVHFIRSERRLAPQQARQLAVDRSHGALLAFTDPDVYPAPEWLESLLAAQRETGAAAIVGSLACHGRGWLDRGIHYCKFSKWLPAGERRAVDMGPTVNLLVTRAAYEDHRGLEDDPWLGDVTLSRNLRAAGETLCFEPRAVVEHHHRATLGRFLSERWQRGKLYSALLARAQRPSAARRMARLVVTVLPARLLTNLGHSARHAWRAGRLTDWAWTLPVHAAGWVATLGGEAAGLVEGLRSGSGSRLADFEVAEAQRRVPGAGQEPSRLTEGGGDHHPTVGPERTQQ
jgi:GT2 family glycosyltransferase